ncbi:MAG: hypothetical protein SV422_02185 [Pseudomonadota bacterium]|nr:hypothetical protein [Pseudomonadota bacterium]
MADAFDTPDKVADSAAAAQFNVLKEGGGSQNLTDYLNRQMVPVPGFTPPSVQGGDVCQIPAMCSQEDSNEYRSAGVLLQALAAEARAWSERLPDDFRPAIVAILHGGLQVEVHELAQVSFDGIRIEGTLGDSPCSILAHQGTVQLICHAVRIDADEEPRPIGFVWPDRDEKI